ncbi:MAG: plasmid mobilization relaxosome protein MobC [Erythrobacter sp.]
MSRGRRLTETERLSIAEERSQGVAAGDLATRYGVSLKSVYNAANHTADRPTANGSRPKVIGVRVSPKELQRFDAALARHGVLHRSDALRCLILAADDILRPDEDMTDELRNLSAALNRVGNNVNQVARRLNEAKLKGERLPYTPASHAEIRDLAVLVFDMADQIQEMFRARRRVLDLEVTKALAGLARQDTEQVAEQGAE